MKKILSYLIVPVLFFAFTSIAGATDVGQYQQVAMSKRMSKKHHSSNPCASNPCASNPCMSNPCASNPCGSNPCASNPCMSNPCMSNPCSSNPCGAKNPCMMKNPCASSSLHLGEKLWKDVSLGKSGSSCSSCHPNGQGLYNTPYPKYIKMPDKVITLKGMVNFCMITPMKAKPLDVNGSKMKALVAYINAYSSAPNPCGAKNPCGGMNPCGAKNPCSAGMNPCSAGMNPCSAGMNPCSAGMNPCSAGMNPCSAGMNPCSAGMNPCGAKNPCGGM